MAMVNAFKPYNVESVKYRLGMSVPSELNLEQFDGPEILCQTDTYYRSKNGDKIMIREDRTGRVGIRYVYAIRYDTPDLTKESHHDFYEIGKYSQFMDVFGGALHEELKIIKVRNIYMYENVRIHVDDVSELGVFLEIEIVTCSDEQAANAENQMQTLISKLSLDQYPTVGCGYRELMIRKDDS